MSTVLTSKLKSLSLPEKIASNIEAMIHEGQFEEGAPLVERVLAERFKVSRSPIRQALQILESASIVVARPDGGYVVNKVRSSSSSIFEDSASPIADDIETVYFKIAEDRLGGKLPDRVSESDLMRRYGLTKSKLANILQRIIQEDWIERLPGNGWQFSPVLTSPEAYDQGFRFRILIESAGLSEPGFKVNEVVLRRCLAEQQELIDGAVEWVSPAQLFDANTRLHEAIAEFSGNIFIIESLKRINRLRRLMEYKKSVDRNYAAQRCKEHKVLINLLLSGDIEAATDFLRLHLRDAAREKSKMSIAG